jgi:putative DNA-invertase from lambdoid prophage Rac
MPKFFGYTRASTAGQQYTFEAQQKAILAAYEAKYKPEGYEWGGFFEDKAVSGSKPFTERPQGLRVWAGSQPGDAICWAKMDRAFRNVVDAANLLQMFQAKGVAVVSLDVALDTGTALGKFVMHLLALMGELEREWIRQRTKDALAVRQEKGLPHSGRPPIGWMKREDGTWVHDDAERALIDWAIDLNHNHGMTWTRIVAHLNSKGVRRANGDRYHQPWFHYAVKAKEHGYPGRDGWREKCQFGGSKRREGKKPYRREQGNKQRAEAKADLLQRLSVCPSDPSESSSPSVDHGQTPGQTP